MKKIALFIADGSEEIEALTPVDVIRRAGETVEIISVAGKYVKSSHGITIKADKTIDDFVAEDYCAFIVPGGMPGAQNLSANQAVISALTHAFGAQKLVAAICASPAVVLAKNGFITGKNATCYPSKDFLSLMEQANYVDKDVVEDGNLITANGPRAAMEFSLTICKYLGISPKF